MQIVDITKTDQYNNLWAQCLFFIQENCIADPLYNNYVNLDKKDFISLPVVILDNNIIAFSGAQFKPDVWGHNIARISSRFWTHPLYRHSISKFQTSDKPWYNSEFLIQHQIAEVKQLDIPHMFISREGNYRKSFQQYINLVNKYNATNFKLLEEYYLIQNTPQLIAVHSNDNVLQILKEETLLKQIDIRGVTND
jgi:hypothetical protein